VFATAFDRYALDAFAVDATDYLVKPITRARLAATLSRVRERLSRRSELERELTAASAAQAALLPRSMPSIPGVDAAALTLPARGVGGDFFVAQSLRDGRVVLALGDVAGKGLPAGLVASSLQARIEAVSRHATGSASDVVADVNQTLCATSDGARFATLTYLELSPPVASVTLINAGHLPSLLLDAADTTHYVASGAPALGLMPHARFPSTEVMLPAGATLVLYSDGVTEAFSPEGEEFGEVRLLGVLRGALSDTAAGICQRVVDAVHQHTNHVASDDVTVLALKRI
jgi:sigma-B regulation protein RsbU (phosphoserine phosphatase)